MSEVIPEQLLSEFLEDNPLLRAPASTSVGPETDNPFFYRLVVYPTGSLDGPCKEIGPRFTSSVDCEHFVARLEEFIIERNLTCKAWINPERK